MSVIKSKRSESEMQFADTAKKLYILTKGICIRLPKRCKDFGVKQMYDCARRMRENVKKGNSTYPTNKEEYQKRRNYFIEAVNELFVLLDYIDECQEDYPEIKPNTIYEWVGYCEDEIRLLKGLMKKDQQRYSKLFT